MQPNQTTSGSKPGGVGVFKYELLLLLMSMIWGSAFVAQQIGMEKGLGPMTFNGLRFALGCVSLIPLILWRKKNLPASDWEAKLPYKACLGAGLFLFAAAALQQIGLQYTSSANSGFITGNRGQGADSNKPCAMKCRDSNTAHSQKQGGD